MGVSLAKAMPTFTRWAREAHGALHAVKDSVRSVAAPGAKSRALAMAALALPLALPVGAKAEDAPKKSTKEVKAIHQKADQALLAAANRAREARLKEAERVLRSEPARMNELSKFHQKYVVEKGNTTSAVIGSLDSDRADLYQAFLKLSGLNK